MLGKIHMKHCQIYCQTKILFTTVGIKSKLRKVWPISWQPTSKLESVSVSICRSFKISTPMKTLSRKYYYGFNELLNYDNQNSCIKHALDFMLYLIPVYK